MNIITINTKDGQLQTSLDTIRQNDVLMQSLKGNRIDVDISMYNMNTILNKLRGYKGLSSRQLESDAAVKGKSIDVDLDEAYDASKLGYTFDSFVKINVGGEIFYLPKNLLINRLEYFELFFSLHPQLDEDYTSILIDRCPEIFRAIIDYIKYDIPSNYFSKRIKVDLLYYGYRNNDGVFIDMDAFDYVKFDSNIYTFETLKGESVENFIRYRIVDPKHKLLCKVFKMTDKRWYKMIRVERIDREEVDICLLIAQKKVLRCSEDTLIFKEKIDHPYNIIIPKTLEIEYVKICKAATLYKSYEYKKIYHKIPYGSSQEKTLKVSINMDILTNPDIKNAPITFFDNIVLHSLNKKIAYVELKRDSKIICKSKCTKDYHTTSWNQIIALINGSEMEYLIDANASHELVVTFTKPCHGDLIIQTSITTYGK